MSSERPGREGPTGFGRLAIVQVVAVMVALVLLAGGLWEERGGDRDFPTPIPDRSRLAPIASEWGVFRLGSDELAVAPEFSSARQGHVRSLDLHRRLRAYPGAPPRIPHGLTDEEFRSGRCNVCHQRGGWVDRFGAYAPVTPHPEYAACLQCHMPSDELVGRPPPAPGELVCAQCHVDLDRPPPTFVPTRWSGGDWPALGVQAMEGSPHVIPHDVETRANCLACHGGPAAVAELRTDHPERVNCRQCHVSVEGS